MSGSDDHVAIMDDWMLPSPSPRSFFSSMMNNGDVAQSVAGSGQSGPQGERLSGTVDQNDHNSNTMGEPKTSSRGGLMERIAARAGFNAPRLNTESIKATDLSNNQQIRSPYFTVPPGISPTTLLDSPVFLTNSLVQPSPTTGKLSFPASGNELNSDLMTGGPDKGKEYIFEDVNASSFAFKPVSDSVSFPCFNAPNKSFPSVHSDKSVFHHQASQVENNGGSNYLLERTYNSVGDSDDGDRNNGGSPGEDGYKWRKYGQKEVKGSEYPKSYYKCTYSYCPVKKKVERSNEGHITEIIYKGAHNHPKPSSPNRQSAHLDSEQPGIDANADFAWSDMQIGRPDNLESTSSALLGQPYNNQAATLQGQSGAQYESPSLSNDEDNDDGAMHGSVSLGYVGEEDESEQKRRRVETYGPEMSGPSRAMREPRVVVQTTSEVDILDDGYRWRKYGQKIVKGNPNPRSYYKCTSAGCNVRKHVERASNDLKSVITTYEGKHNHDVPAARNTNSRGPNTLSSQQANANANANASYSSRPEPSQIHGRSSLGFPGFGSNPGFGMNQHGLGLGPNQGKLPVFPVHPYLGHHSRSANDMSFMQPKFEPVTDSGLNSSNAASVYQQLMNRLPLGPHM